MGPVIVRERTGMAAAVLGLVALVVIGLAYLGGNGPTWVVQPAATTVQASPAVGYCPGCGQP